MHRIASALRISQGSIEPKSYANLGKGHSQGLMVTTFICIANYYVYLDSHQFLENTLWSLLVTIQEVKSYKNDPLNWVLPFSEQQ